MDELSFGSNYFAYFFLKNLIIFLLQIQGNLNKTKIHNLNELLDLVFKRSPNKPLITVSNHFSCCDDPLVFGKFFFFNFDFNDNLN